LGALARGACADEDPEVLAKSRGGRQRAGQVLSAPEPRGASSRGATESLTCPKVARRLGDALARPQLPLVWGARAVVLGSRDRVV
jgi:hypothetical protein